MVRMKFVRITMLLAGIAYAILTSSCTRKDAKTKFQFKKHEFIGLDVYNSQNYFVNPTGIAHHSISHLPSTDTSRLRSILFVWNFKSHQVPDTFWEKINSAKLKKAETTFWNLCGYLILRTKTGNDEMIMFNEDGLGIYHDFVFDMDSLNKVLGIMCDTSGYYYTDPQMYEFWKDDQRLRPMPGKGEK